MTKVFIVTVLALFAMTTTADAAWSRKARGYQRCAPGYIAQMPNCKKDQPQPGGKR
jgi:hypothetical protein